jgi:hypothetical protein
VVHFRRNLASYAASAFDPEVEAAFPFGRRSILCAEIQPSTAPARALLPAISSPPSFHGDVENRPRAVDGECAEGRSAPADAVGDVEREEGLACFGLAGEQEEAFVRQEALDEHGRERADVGQELGCGNGCGDLRRLLRILAVMDGVDGSV